MRAIDLTLPDEFVRPLIAFIQDTRSHVATLNYDALLYRPMISEEILRGYNGELVDGFQEQRGFPLPLIQTTAAISPGSSGGGLFDQYGRAIGVTVGYLEGGQNLNFALPIELSERLPQVFRASP